MKELQLSSRLPHLQLSPLEKDRVKPLQHPSLLYTLKQLAHAAYGSATTTDWTPVTHSPQFLAEDNSHQQCENGEL